MIGKIKIILSDRTVFDKIIYLRRTVDLISVSRVFILHILYRGNIDRFKGAAPLAVIIVVVVLYDVIDDDVFGFVRTVREGDVIGIVGGKAHGLFLQHKDAFGLDRTAEARDVL